MEGGVLSSLTHSSSTYFVGDIVLGKCYSLLNWYKLIKFALEYLQFDLVTLQAQVIDNKI